MHILKKLLPFLRLIISTGHMSVLFALRPNVSSRFSGSKPTCKTAQASMKLNSPPAPRTGWHTRNRGIPVLHILHQGQINLLLTSSIATSRRAADVVPACRSYSLAAVLGGKFFG